MGWRDTCVFATRLRNRRVCARSGQLLPTQRSAARGQSRRRTGLPAALARPPQPQLWPLPVAARVPAQSITGRPSMVTDNGIKGC